MKTFKFSILLIIISSRLLNAQSVPKNLLIYYGYPSLINAATNQAAAVSAFSNYDFVVWGNGVDLYSKVGAERHRAASLLQAIRTNKPGIKVFGYLYLGTTIGSQLVQASDFTKRLDSIKVFGFDGVLLDECGYSPLINNIPNCSRQRLVTAVDYAHSIGLSVICNTQYPEEILRNNYSVHNPNNLLTPFKVTDYYLYESYLVRYGAYYKNGLQVAYNEWEYWRLSKSQQLKLETPSGLVEMPTLSIGTADSGHPNYTCATSDFSSRKIDSLFQFMWYGAWMNGHIATGWGECSFSATSNRAPFRTRPIVGNPGSFAPNSSPINLIRDTSKFPPDSVYYFRETSTGRVWINTSSNHHYGFTEFGKNASVESGDWFNLKTWSMYHVPLNNEKVYINKHLGSGVYVPNNGNLANCKDIVTANGSVFEIRIGARFGCPN